MNRKYKNSIIKTHPHLLEEWDDDKNEIKPEEATQGSGKKVWWVCKKEDCKYEWEALICKRALKIKPTGCPSCAGQVITEINNLKYLFPVISKEWDFDLNRMSPEEVFPNSNKSVWWKCGKCMRSWKTYIYSRTGAHSRCPLCFKGPVSKISQEWLDSLGIKIREYKIKTGNFSFKVDGFDPETNTVYEFLGDYWHGNPEVYHKEKVNASSKRLFGELYEETFCRLRLLEKEGYKVTYIWENDFKNKRLA
ncbi:MAG: zinc-ribbon domain-containing protein [Candidatus Peribacteraceae bacterium]|nr:zinc-ribbon domain-containing protein [Candidatus Peribacteraceae bacterium]